MLIYCISKIMFSIYKLNSFSLAGDFTLPSAQEMSRPTGSITMGDSFHRREYLYIYIYTQRRVAIVKKEEFFGVFLMIGMKKQIRRRSLIYTRCSCLQRRDAGDCLFSHQDQQQQHRSPKGGTAGLRFNYSREFFSRGSTSSSCDSWCVVRRDKNKTKVEEKPMEMRQRKRQELAAGRPPQSK